MARCSLFGLLALVFSAILFGSPRFAFICSLLVRFARLLIFAGYSIRGYAFCYIFPSRPFFCSPLVYFTVSFWIDNPGVNLFLKNKSPAG
jgi:hypothetical protein